MRTSVRQLIYFCQFFLITLLVTACTTTQTTSGRDYLSAYAKPASTPAHTHDINARVREVAAVEPLLTFPARIGIARIEHQDLSVIPTEELDDWLALAEKYGPKIGDFVPVNPLIAESVWSEPRDNLGHPRQVHVTPIRRVLDKIRLGAARQHLDAVLIYEVFGTSSSRENILAIGNLSIIGAFILPSERIHAKGHASAILLDVRNGYPYGTADFTAKENGLAPSLSDRRKRLMDTAEIAAARGLVQEVDKMFTQLLVELTIASAAP